MSLPNKQRNKEIVTKRLRDKKKWTFEALGKHYGLQRSTVQKIFKRETSRKSG